MKDHRSIPLQTQCCCLLVIVATSAAWVRSTVPPEPPSVLSIPPSAASVQAGIVQFACSTHEGTDRGSIWFCQVVGSREVAGWITIETPEQVACGSPSSKPIKMKLQAAASEAVLNITAGAGGAMTVHRDNDLLVELPSIQPRMKKRALPGVIPTILPVPKVSPATVPSRAQIEAVAALANEPAWRLFMTAMADANLAAHLQSRLVAPVPEKAEP